MKLNEIQESLGKQCAALIHIASSCEDQGTAICIENVVEQLDLLSDMLEIKQADDKQDRRNTWNAAKISMQISEKCDRLLKEFESCQHNV